MGFQMEDVNTKTKLIAFCLQSNEKLKMKIKSKKVNHEWKIINEKCASSSISEILKRKIDKVGLYYLSSHLVTQMKLNIFWWTD